MDGGFHLRHGAVLSHTDVLGHDTTRTGLTRGIVTAPEQEFPFNAFAGPVRYAQCARHYA
jgi:hypothetical protein